METQYTLDVGKNVHGMGRKEGNRQRETEALEMRFAGRLAVNPDLSRLVVSAQGNRHCAGMRLFRYKEAFSQHLVEKETDALEGRILDPFSGMGSTVLGACAAGKQGIGIERMPVGAAITRTLLALARTVCAEDLSRKGDALLEAMACATAPREAIPEVPITAHAYPADTRAELERARAWLAQEPDPELRDVLRSLCMSVLEDVSFTRKDGQYLRWDGRSGRSIRGKGLDKGMLEPAHSALAGQIARATNDVEKLRAKYGGRGKPKPEIRTASCLAGLRRLKTASVGGVLTSPPYANRYDYTRTYALELAWLGVNAPGLKGLRQDLLTATVENQRKTEWIERTYRGEAHHERALRALEGQRALREAVRMLEERRGSLSNPHVIRLVEGYFEEMATVVGQLARVTRPGARLVMVNDNVRYEGVEVPVDLILSDVAEGCGWRCDAIETLPRGKGNSSQQMARYGRKELRKCVYRWTRR